MGGWVSVCAAGTAAFLYYGGGHMLLFWISVVITVADFWTFGVMHNYAVAQSATHIKRLRENLAAEGIPEHEVDDRMSNVSPRVNLDAVPNWLAVANFAFAILSLGLLVFAIVVRAQG